MIHGNDSKKALSTLYDYVIVSKKLAANIPSSEAWRYNGPFTRWNRLKGSFPGFGIAAGAFVVYLAYEAVFVKDEHGHGEIGQGKDHHGIAV